MGAPIAIWTDAELATPKAVAEKARTETTLVGPICDEITLALVVVTLTTG
jgi:hypothetical protein